MDFMGDNNGHINDQPEETLNEPSSKEILPGIDDIITNNVNLLSFNTDNSPTNSENDFLKKEIKHESSEVIQVPDIQKDFEIPFSQNTLDESIITTINRDLFLIYTKLKFVVIPYGEKEKKAYHIKQWDLWGIFKWKKTWKRKRI